MSQSCLSVKSLSRSALAALAVITVVGAALRLMQANESLWADELHTAWCACGDFGQVAERAMAGNQSPLFFWGEWLLFKLGKNEIMLRLPSLVAGSLLPLAVFAAAQRLTHSAWLGVFAAWLVTVDPLSIFFATEARPYALVQLLAVLHILLFQKLLERPTAFLRVTFVLGAALLFHLHYTAILLMFAELTFWVIRVLLRREGAYKLLPTLTDAAIIVLICLPALPNVLDVASRRENWAAFVPQQPAGIILSMFPLSGAALYVFADMLAPKQSDETADHGRPDFSPLVLCWFLVPLCIAWLLTATDIARLFFPRYLTVAAPAAFVLSAKYVQLAPSKWFQVFLASAIAVVSFWSSGIGYHLRHDGRAIIDRQEDWRGAIAYLNQHLRDDGVPVLVRSGLIEDDALRESPSVEPPSAELRAYCLSPVTSLYPVHCSPGDLIPLPSTDSGRLAEVTKSRVQQAGSTWIIIRGREDTARAIERQLLDELNGNSSRSSTAADWRITTSQSFGKVHVRQIRRSPDE